MQLISALKGTANGNAVFTAAAGKSFSYRDQGTIRMYVVGKLINAKYYAALNNDSINVAVSGMYVVDNAAHDPHEFAEVQFNQQFYDAGVVSLTI